jgi:hypothetical protein
MPQFDQTLNLMGASGPVDVRFHRLPVRTEAGGNRYRYAYGEFGPDLIDAVYRQLPFVARVGPPWKRRDACGVCAVEMGGTSSRATMTLPMRLGRIPEFEVVFTVPTLVCPSCGDHQVSGDRTLGFHITEAMTQAFQAGNLKP